MGQSNYIKKAIFFQSSDDLTVCFLCPPPHAILYLSPPLFCPTCWFTPPPSVIFSGWYVPRTKSMDGEKAKKKEKSRGQEVTKKRRRGGALVRGQFPVLPHVHASLCCPLAQWDFIKSAQLRKCAVLAKRKMDGELKYM